MKTFSRFPSEIKYYACSKRLFKMVFFLHIQLIECVLFAFSLAGAVFTSNSLEHEDTLFVTGMHNKSAPVTERYFLKNKLPLRLIFRFSLRENFLIQEAILRFDVTVNF